MIVPALQDAVRDRSLRANDVRVFGLLLFELDPVAYRPIKQLYIREILGLSKRTVRQSLQRLEQGGYIELGPITIAAQIRRYRVLYTLLGAKSTPSQAA